MSEPEMEIQQVSLEFTDCSFTSLPDVGPEKGNIVGEKPGLGTSELPPVQNNEKKSGTCESDKEGKKSKPGIKSIIKLFHYATAFDRFLLFIGTIAALLRGAALPLLILALGNLTTAFINQASTQIFVNLINGTVNCSASNFPPLPNCTLNITPATTYAEILQGCISSQTECLTDDDFLQRINTQVYIFLGIAAGVFIVAGLQIMSYQLAAERQVYKIRLQLYQAILRQNIGWFDTNPSGELFSRLTDDMEKILNGIGDKLALFIQWIGVFVGGFVVAFVSEWRLTLLLLAFTPFLVFSGAVFAKLTVSFANREQKEYASAGAVAEEVLSSIRTVVAFGGEYMDIKRYDNKLKEARRLGVKKALTVGFSLGIIFFLIFFVNAAGFWFGAYLVSEQIVEGGDVITALFGVLYGAFNFGQAAPNLEDLLTAAGASGAILDTIDREPPIDSSSSKGIVPEKFDSTIQFKEVDFSYPTRPDVQILDGFSLSVEAGQTIALVGPSGCGKSTVIQLLQRFYDLDSGKILVGGNEISTLNLKWLRSHIGVVSQEPVLFDTTIAENIRYGKKDVTRKEIEKAARNANAHDFISALPDGYNTLVGERGTQLSGGQKQRIAIARALVRDPKILLLDEATSALDTESEAIVQSALDHARKGRTTIVIAHRLSTIQTADVIASIEDGQVAEQGTHTELMKKKGLYYDLVMAQSFGVDEGFVANGIGRQFSLKGSIHRRHHSSSTRRSTHYSKISIRSRRSTRRSNHSRGSVHSRCSQQENANRPQSPVSLQRMTSVLSTGNSEFQRQSLKKMQEEWDKEIPVVPLHRVLRLNAKEWWIIILGLLGAAVGGSICPMFAIFYGEILAVFALPAEEILGEVPLWASLFIVLAVVSGLGIFAKVVCFGISGEALTARLRSKSFKAMLRQEMGWHDDERNSTGALTTRLASDVGEVQGATGSRLGTLIEISIGILMALTIAFAYSWVLSLLFLGVVPLIAITTSLAVTTLSRRAKQQKKALEQSGKIAVDSIENIHTVAALGVEDNFFHQYKKSVEASCKRALLNNLIYGLTYAISQSTIYIMYPILFRFGAFQVLLDPSNVAYAQFQDVFRVFFALIFSGDAAGQAGAFAPNYTKARLSANRIFLLLNRKPVIDGYSEEGTKLEKVAGEVAVSELCFNYPARQDVTVLQGLNLSVMAGKTLALVGPSGCGKSTVMSLIVRFYDPLSGGLFLDGTDLKNLNIRWLRSQIGIVSQEPVLFDASIADNIRYGANFRDVSDEEVIEAAKAANIHSFVESLPQGYNTSVGAKGTQLSGGQKQRIAIARALVRNPKILLLDEATSALDTESEKIVQDALDKAREGRTSIVIAHRLSTIYNADRIAVIKGGKVAEVGTHSELLAMKELYYKLNRYQMIVNPEESQINAEPVINTELDI